ncbi:hypothetical protein [Corynebacterium qintianiae]|uniref:hypothetical protein n=1 Tax=Corynebacterium qintianiae TaxID=2709392 RepID=UPI0013EB023F|nr:hypothetical protein [Corynebacterium qintianiae]
MAANLQRAGQMNEHAQGVILDAIGTVRGGRILAPHAIHDLATSLRRHKLAHVLTDTADALYTAATGSDDDVRKALRYAHYLPQYAARAGVKLDD